MRASCWAENESEERHRLHYTHAGSYFFVTCFGWAITLILFDARAFNAERRILYGRGWSNQQQKLLAGRERRIIRAHQYVHVFLLDSSPVGSCQQRDVLFVGQMVHGVFDPFGQHVCDSRFSANQLINPLPSVTSTRLGFSSFLFPLSILHHSTLLPLPARTIRRFNRIRRFERRWICRPRRFAKKKTWGRDTKRKHKKKKQKREFSNFGEIYHHETPSLSNP